VKIILLAALAILLSQSAGGADTTREDVAFVSHGAALSGTLVLPAGTIHAAVVFVHGSGRQERSLAWAERFAADGIAALVYDKRGTGKSGGEYEGDQSVSGMNIALLAEDAIAGVGKLATHPRLKQTAIGLAGISQAGWIAPLAARNSRVVRFLVLWSGPVCKVSEEDIYSKYTGDTDGALAPTFREALAAREQKYLWPDFLGRDTDSAEDLAKLSIPGLWIFSDNDRSIPVDLSLQQLQSLRARGHRYDYVLFSGLGHNNMEHTFAVATDWLRHLPK
jgi:uncharacterized protein